MCINWKIHIYNLSIIVRVNALNLKRTKPIGTNNTPVLLERYSHK